MSISTSPSPQSNTSSNDGQVRLEPGPPRMHRVASVDIFRGFTMLLMIFVNDLSGVKGLPWWNYHMEEKNGMTYVDMVFPAFLFIVGMAVPLAIRNRLSKGSSIGALWIHVLLRSLSLIVLGLVLANADKGDPSQMHISQNVWASLALVGAILLWNVYPVSQRYGVLFRSLKITGALLLAAMFIIFRRTTESGHTAWIDPSYWEILGLIGWTYLAVCLLYIPTRKWRWAPVTWFAVLAALNILSAARWLSFPDQLPFYWWPFNNGAFGMLAFAGMITSTIFLGDSRLKTLREKTVWALLFALVLFAGGLLCTPLGISKIHATPTWCFYSAGASVLIFLGLYYICDVQRNTRWAAFVKPAGSNTLLTYLLPDLFYFMVGTSWLSPVFGHGWTGVIKAAAFTGFILVLSALLTKLRVRVQL